MSTRCQPPARRRWSAAPLAESRVSAACWPARFQTHHVHPAIAGATAATMVVVPTSNRLAPPERKSRTQGPASRRSQRVDDGLDVGLCGAPAVDRLTRNAL